MYVPSISSATVSLPSIRRGSMRCPRKRRLASCAVCFTPLFSRCSAAIFCSAFGPAADALPCRDALNPPRSLSAGFFPPLVPRLPPPAPFPSLLFLLPIYPLVSEFFVLVASGFAKRLVCADDRIRCFSGIVGDEHQVQITVGDLPLTPNTRVEPAQQAGPVVSAGQNDPASI